MSAIERVTITLPAEMATLLKDAVVQGEYASSSEVVREALRDWKLKKELQLHELALLRAEIDRGLAQVVGGQIADFNLERVIERGRRLLANRSPSV